MASGGLEGETGRRSISRSQRKSRGSPYIRMGDGSVLERARREVTLNPWMSIGHVAESSSYMHNV